MKLFHGCLSESYEKRLFLIPVYDPADATKQLCPAVFNLFACANILSVPKASVGHCGTIYIKEILKSYSIRQTFSLTPA